MEGSVPSIPSAIPFAANSVPTAKPKQSKSRNGCSTCKAKRLKCDETKPTCCQCHRRNVVCGGYKKDFKWKSFGRSSFMEKFAVRDGGKDRYSQGHKHAKGLMPFNITTQTEHQAHPAAAASKLSTPSTETLPPIEPSEGSAAEHIEHIDYAPVRSRSATPTASKTDSRICILTPYDTAWRREASADGSWGFDASGSPPYCDDFSHPTLTPSTPASDLSPTFDFQSLFIEYEDKDLKVVTGHNKTESSHWNLGLSGDIFFGPIKHGPFLHAESPEMLLMRYDRHTCGILSIKDGMTENPWRTLVWPLAADSPALYHAICALAAFHCSQVEPSLKLKGLDHMRRSIRTLAREIRNMRPDAALATTLTLAFAEVWDQTVKTGVEHLRGAKALVSRALVFQQSNSLRHSDFTRLRFLYNAWTYTSVLARLTSLEGIDDDDEPLSIPAGPSTLVHEIDPLMGCAATLFPLISRLASLVRTVRATPTTSLSLISAALDLQTLLQQWKPPSRFEPPEDPTSNVQHCILTAYAYRLAALMHLHQTVPELPSPSSADLARRICVLLANIPPSSRTVIVQIYPLLTAGCEMDGAEDRAWVRGRWEAMRARMRIGNVDRCVDVVEEVWARRDAYAETVLGEEAPPLSTPTFQLPEIIGTFDEWIGDYRALPVWDNIADGSGRQYAIEQDSLAHPYSIRGNLHWSAVMRDWGWEVLLG